MSKQVFYTETKTGILHKFVHHFSVESNPPWFQTSGQTMVCKERLQVA
jgi:hypothetical protein